MRNIRFPGQYYDAETGLDYNRFRYYDPSIGRYISADPIGQAGGVNVFAYALNDPVGDFDPYGLNNFGGPIFQSSNPNAPLYRPPVPSLFDIKADATSFAEGLPGRSKGERDAVRHCVASCEAASAYGQSVSSAAGTLNELQRSARGGQTTGDRKMDDFNNEVGRDLAKNAADCGNKPDCKKSCVDALNSGRLDTASGGTGQQYGPGGYTR